MQNNLNIFLYGLSGAGKDTIANYLRDNFNYLKLRIAGTIKQYVFETNGFESQEQFEEEKRNRPEIRKQHHIFGKQYDEDGLKLSNREATYNRVESLINRTALEFEIVRNTKDLPLCIVDAREFNEVETLLNAGFIGIFLTRQNKKEYIDSKHKTEQNLFERLDEFSNKKNIAIIHNHDNANIFDSEMSELDKKIFSFQTYTTDGSNKELIDSLIKILRIYHIL